MCFLLPELLVTCKSHGKTHVRHPSKINFANCVIITLSNYSAGKRDREKIKIPLIKSLTITNFVDTDTIVSDGRLASPSLCAQGAVFCAYRVKMRPSDFSSMPQI